MSEKFKFTYSAPTEAERREIEDIKRAYTSNEKGESKIEQLRKLNRRVFLPPRIIAVLIGILGTLIMGFGMTLGLEWQNYIWGIPVGVVGIVIMVIAYPVYKVILKHNKALYGQEIIRLSDEILNEQ